MKKFLLIATIIATGMANAQDRTVIYRAGEDGYACFRIPSIITTNSKTVLAFAEARRNNCGDAGDIDLVVKRSEDGGKTWSGLQIVWNDSTNTCGNPAPVVDKSSGKIYMLSTWNLGTDHEKDIIAGTSKDTRRVYVLSSADDGRTWSAPTEITSSVKQPGWTWYATGPGRGVQLTKGRHKGRLVVSCNHITAADKRNYSHAIYSDNGSEWKLGGITPQDSVNESTIAELSNGRLMLNMRNASKKRVRQVAISKDGGERWSNIRADTLLHEPVCEGNLLLYAFAGKPSRLLFLNPASKKGRELMTLRIGKANGKGWLSSRLLYAGPAAYSCMTVLPDGRVGCFYEAGEKKPYETMVFEAVEIE